MTVSARPGPDEYLARFAAYVTLVADGEDVLAVLAAQLEQLGGRLAAVPEARGDIRYAAGKWSIKELVGHLSDTERVFAYRALRIGRGDATPLPGYDDQAYVSEQHASERSMADLAGEWGDVRRATLALFRNMPAPAWRRSGIAGDGPVSVRALAYIIAGHTWHHAEVLAARYGA